MTGTDRQTTNAEVTVETLQAFAEAWNRHDIEGLMSFMADDCVFESWSGTEIIGSSFSGRAAVRAGFMLAWQTFPDAQWEDGRHFIAGDRGVSEWIFSGTNPEGQAVRMAGCDIFHFRGGKIVKKNS